MASFFAIFLYTLAVYNLAKLPWYFGLIETPSYGLEASMPLHWLGFRAVKLQSHPVLFLAIHCMLGATLLALYAYHFDHPLASPTTPYYIVAVILALHVIPERSGVPNRTKPGHPVNETAIVVILVTATAHYFNFLSNSTCMTIIFLPLIAAASLELLPFVIFLVKKIASGGSFECTSPDGDQPLPRNMKGYTGCPCAKFFDTQKSSYETIPDSLVV